MAYRSRQSIFYRPSSVVDSGRDGSPIYTHFLFPFGGHFGDATQRHKSIARRIGRLLLGGFPPAVLRRIRQVVVDASNTIPVIWDVPHIRLEGGKIVPSGLYNNTATPISRPFGISGIVASAHHIRPDVVCLGAGPAVCSGAGPILFAVEAVATQNATRAEMGLHDFDFLAAITLTFPTAMRTSAGEHPTVGLSQNHESSEALPSKIKRFLVCWSNGRYDCVRHACSPTRTTCSEPVKARTFIGSLYSSFTPGVVNPFLPEMREAA